MKNEKPAYKVKFTIELTDDEYNTLNDTEVNSENLSFDKAFGLFTDLRTSLNEVTDSFWANEIKLETAKTK